MKSLRGLIAGALVALGGMTGQIQAQEPVAGVQPEITTATYQDWLVRCMAAAEATRLCEVVQNLEVQGQGLVATVALGKIAADGELRLVVQVPAGVWLPGGVSFAIAEDSEPLKLQYTRCLQGCFAELELDAATVEAMRSATVQGSFSFEDGARRPVKLPVSFKGLAPALDASLKP